MCDNQKEVGTVKQGDCIAEARGTNASADSRFPRKAFCVAATSGPDKQFTVFGPFETEGHAVEYAGMQSVVLPMIVPGNSQSIQHSELVRQQRTIDALNADVVRLLDERDLAIRQRDEARVFSEGVQDGADSLRRSYERLQLAYEDRGQTLIAVRHQLCELRSHQAHAQLLQDIKAFLLGFEDCEDNGPTVRGLLAQIDTASV